VRLITSAIADACLYGTARRRDNLAGRERGGGEAAPGPRGPDAQVIYAHRPRAHEPS
jgi:hypothetical protein